MKNRAGYEYLGQDYPALRFPDVKRTAWYYGSVEKAAQLGLFQGDEQELFQPGKAITRGQFVRTLYNALASPGGGSRLFGRGPGRLVLRGRGLGLGKPGDLRL